MSKEKHLPYGLCREEPVGKNNGALRVILHHALGREHGRKVLRCHTCNLHLRVHCLRPRERSGRPSMRVFGFLLA